MRLADKQLCDSCRTVSSRRLDQCLSATDYDAAHSVREFDFRFAGGKLGVAILAGAIGRAPGISDPGGLL